MLNYFKVNYKHHDTIHDLEGAAHEKSNYPGPWQFLNETAHPGYSNLKWKWLVISDAFLGLGYVAESTYIDF